MRAFKKPQLDAPLHLKSRRDLVSSSIALSTGVASGATAASDSGQRFPEGGAAAAAGDWRRFPEGFAWGAATSAFQIEGGALEAGKAPSIWDTFSHVPGNVYDGSTADVACDHLHRYKEDVALMQEVGLKWYRFSISWSRVLPVGTLAGGVNEAGLAFYEDLLLELQAKGIEPVVTLYHWDLPQALEDAGGWLDESTVDAFRDYAQLCFARFGRLARTWCTINEPWTQCVLGYNYGSHAPGRSVSPGTEPYLAGHHMLLAHAAAVKVFRATQQPGSRIALVLNTQWYEPQEPWNPADVAASDRALAWMLGWFAEPLYKGDYPAVMRERCGERLPSFTDAQKRDLLGSNDFFAVNYYSASYACENNSWRGLQNAPARLRAFPWTAKVIASKVMAGVRDSQPPLDGKVSRGGPAAPVGVPSTSWDNDAAFLSILPLELEMTEMGWVVSHFGLGRLLCYIQREYAPPGGTFVTEAGVAVADEARRTDYLRQQALVLKRAILEGADVRGYFWWSLYDNFEWAAGYGPRFGLFAVDFASRSLERRPRSVAKEFQRLLERNALDTGVRYEELSASLRRPDGR